MMSQRIILVTATAAIVSFILLVTLYQTDQTPWRRLTIPNPHLDSWHSASKDTDSTEEPHATSTPVKGPSVQPALGSPPSSTQPETTLVLATLSSTDNSWVEGELGDLLGPYSNLYTAIYVVDDDTAPLHTPANKGHEAMAYLTYLIDFYDHLPEISIFMHGHPTTWHNNLLLDMSSSEMVRNLDRSRVLRDGYFNLRCDWAPGCQPGLNPAATKYDNEKPEELIIGEAWQTLFPFDEVPEMLAQPCCSQFAVSRETVHAHPRERYIQFRDWLLETELEDFYTGRVFEYFWHWIFKRVTTFCPDPRICYCEGYGVCFEDPQDYGRFFELVTELDVYREELKSWGNWTDDKTVTRRNIDGCDDDGRAEPDDWAHDEILALSGEIWKPRRKGMADIAASLRAGEHASKYGAALPWSQGRPWGKNKSTQRRRRSINAATSHETQKVTVEEGPDPAEVGQAGREEWLEHKIDEIIAQLDKLKAAAFEAGKDPASKQAALAAMRNLTMGEDHEVPTV